MKKNIVTAALAVATICAIGAKSGNDPVLMTVNNKPVHKSEFEYLYHKNNTQQLQPQTLDEYVEMFVNYKLKVADAEAKGLDTTKTFLDEFNKFKNELAAPYLTETATIDSLVNAAYSHYAEMRFVRHIMIYSGYTSEETAAAKDKLDSLRTAIVNGSADWDQAALQYSVDASSKERGGIMGWMPAGIFPWQFEDMAYQTKIGDISPVVNSGFGFHIIRVDSVKPNPGEVHVEHILKLTQGLDPEATAQVALKVDSIRALLVAGADFSDMAKRESQDPGSAARGGDLGWFGIGKMIKPFEEASFTLADGEISAPVKTAYGYHILHKLGHRDVAPLEEMRTELEARINGDERADIIRGVKINRLTKQFNAHLDEGGFEQLAKLIGSSYDSTAIERLKNSDIILYRIGKNITGSVGEVIAYVPQTISTSVDDAVWQIRLAATRVMEARLLDLECDALLETNADYRNLVNEYRDGILLFARASEVVWDRPTQDPAALENYFKQNRDKYTWDQPKFKGYIILAQNDSVLNAIKAFTDSIDTPIDHKTFASTMRSKFKRQVKVERVIAAKGDNPITDYLVFGGTKPEEAKTGWNFYFTFDGRIINAPEEASDVRGAVTTDFQNHLEQEWIKELRAKYPVTIKRKVLKTVK